MAETKTTTKTEEVTNKNELVEVHLKRIPDPKAPQVEFYSLNFKNYLIRRGETVLVPKELKALIDEQERAENEAMDYINNLVSKEA